MAIDLQSEPPLPYNEAGKLLPADRRPSATTWWRWSTRGVHGIKLETILIGGRRYTTAAALQRFVDQLSERSAGATSSSVDQLSERSAGATSIPRRSPHQRQVGLARAEDELRRHKI